MDAEMIILCDGVVIPQSKKKLTGCGNCRRTYPADRGACGIIGLSGSGYGGGGIP